MCRRRRCAEAIIELAMDLANQSGVTKRQIAEELGIDTKMFGRWCQVQSTREPKAFPGPGEARDDDIAALKRELARVKKERSILNECRSVLTGRVEVKYRMIERCRDAFPVRMTRRQLSVSASGFYGWLASPLSARA